MAHPDMHWNVTEKCTFMSGFLVWYLYRPIYFVSAMFRMNTLNKCFGHATVEEIVDSLVRFLFPERIYNRFFINAKPGCWFNVGKE